MDKETLREEKLRDELLDSVMDAHNELQAYEDIDIFVELYAPTELGEMLDELKKHSAEHGHRFEDVMDLL